MEIKSGVSVELEEMPPPVAMKKDVKAVVAEPFHLHHAIVGIAVVVGGVIGAAVVPSLKTETRIMVAGLSALMGGILLYDDLTQHWEHGCSLDTIWNFTPCPEVAPVVVKKL